MILGVRNFLVLLYNFLGICNNQSGWVLIENWDGKISNKKSARWNLYPSFASRNCKKLLFLKITIQFQEINVDNGEICTTNLNIIRFPVSEIEVLSL